MCKIYETSVAYKSHKGVVIKRSFNRGERVSYHAFSLIDDREFPTKAEAVRYLGDVFALVVETAQ